jgi:hypothetical protein
MSGDDVRRSPTSAVARHWQRPGSPRARKIIYKTRAEMKSRNPRAEKESFMFVSSEEGVRRRTSLE